MNIYLESFGIFFKIGAFTIGGGYAMVPLIENEIVTKRKWIAQEDFIDLLAISQSAPGILAVNISIFIGYKLRGIRGSIVTALGILQKTEKTISLTIFLLLFILGVSIGSNSLIVNNLGKFGWQAIILAVSGVLGSLLAARLVLQLFFKKGGKQ